MALTLNARDKKIILHLFTLVTGIFMLGYKPFSASLNPIINPGPPFTAVITRIRQYLPNL